MDVRPIRTEADLTWALAEVEAYFVDPPAPGSAAADRFDVLTDLIETYENRHYPIETPDPVEAIVFYMEEAGKTASDLSVVLGSKSRASEIMARKRSLSLEMIRKIVRAWPIPAEALIAPYHVERS